MDNFQVQLHVLLDILDKKKSYLLQIVGITENQEAILISPQAGSDEGAMFFDGLNGEKQKLIELVLDSDKLFQHSFDEIKECLEQRAHEFKPEVAALKEIIKAIVELDSKIRVMEEKNKMLLGKSKPGKKLRTAGINKSYVLKQYEKHKKSD